MTSIFETVLSLSIGGSLIALIATAVHLGFKNRIPKTLMFVFWGVVFLKLMVPVSIPSPLSIHNVINLDAAVEDILKPETPAFREPCGIIKDTTGDTETHLPVVSIKGNENIQPGNQKIQDPVHDPSDFRNPSNPALIKKEIPYMLYLSGIWMLGMLALLIRLCIMFHFLKQSFKSARKFENEWTRAFLTGQKIKRKIQILTSENVETPVVFGFVNSKIIFPAGFDFSDRKTLFYILRHEYEHIVHFDNLISFLSMLVVCVHWFNPVVWVSRAMLCKDIEYGCDERVLRAIGPGQKADYADLILSCATAKKAGSVRFVVGFGHTTIKERVKRIMKIKKITMTAAIAAIAATVFIISVFATAASGSGAKDDKNTGPLPTTNNSEKLVPEETTKTGEPAVEPTGGAGDTETDVNGIGTTEPAGEPVLPVAQNPDGQAPGNEPPAQSSQSSGGVPVNPPPQHQTGATAQRPVQPPATGTTAPKNTVLPAQSTTVPKNTVPPTVPKPTIPMTTVPLPSNPEKTLISKYQLRVSAVAYIDEMPTYYVDGSNWYLAPPRSHIWITINSDLKGFDKPVSVEAQVETIGFCPLIDVNLSSDSPIFAPNYCQRFGTNCTDYLKFVEGEMVNLHLKITCDGETQELVIPSTVKVYM